jgi:hypothetical protein
MSFEAGHDLALAVYARLAESQLLLSVREMFPYSVSIHNMTRRKDRQLDPLSRDVAAG